MRRRVSGRDAVLPSYRRAQGTDKEGVLRPADALILGVDIGLFLFAYALFLFFAVVRCIGAPSHWYLTHFEETHGSRLFSPARGLDLLLLGV